MIPRSALRAGQVLVGAVAAALALAARAAPAEAHFLTERVSVATGGAQGNGVSSGVAISADGRFVAFQSDASNLVPGDGNGVQDVFVRDRQAGRTERVSVSTRGAQGNGTSGGLAISADGRFVAFGSDASNLVPNDTNCAGDVFVHDRVNGTTRRVSVSSGAPRAMASASPASRHSRLMGASSRSRRWPPTWYRATPTPCRTSSSATAGRG